MRKFTFWLLQWGRLIAALIAICTYSKIDFALHFERIYLDYWSRRA